MSELIRGSRRSVTYCRETVPGETPINPVMKHFRGLPGVNFTREAARLEVNEITPDRQRPLPRLGSIGSKGELPIEYAYGAFDDLIEAVLESDPGWSTPLSVASSLISANGTGNAFLHSGGGFAFAAGDLVEVSGFSDPANNGLFRVKEAASGSLTVAGLRDLADEAAGAAVTVSRPEYVEVGATQRTFTFQERLKDIAEGAQGQRMLGQVVDSWQLTVGVEGLVKGVFGLVGREGVIAESRTANTLSAAAADSSFNDSDEKLGGFAPGDALYASGFAQAANNGVFTVVSVSAGKLVVDGTLADEAAGGLATLTTVLPDPPAAMNANEAFAGVDKGQLVSEGGLSMALVTEIALVLENGSTGYWQLGGRGAVDVLDGGFKASGTVTVYVKNLGLLKKFLAEEESSLSFTLADPRGNAYTHFLPSIRYTGAPLTFKGDGAVVSRMPFEAGRSEAFGTTCVVMRRPA